MRIMMENEIATKCVICGSQIHAGSYPPVCNKKYNNCRHELELEVEYIKFVKKGDK